MAPSHQQGFYQQGNETVAGSLKLWEEADSGRSIYHISLSNNHICHLTHMKRKYFNLLAGTFEKDNPSIFYLLVKNQRNYQDAITSISWLLKNLLFVSLLLFCTCAHLMSGGEGRRKPQHTWEVGRYWYSFFSPPPCMCVSWIELKSPGLQNKHCYPLSHLVYPK